jgi:hypothetical protein
MMRNDLGLFRSEKHRDGLLPVTLINGRNYMSKSTTLQEQVLAAKSGEFLIGNDLRVGINF